MGVPLHPGGGEILTNIFWYKKKRVWVKWLSGKEVLSKHCQNKEGEEEERKEVTNGRGRVPWIVCILKQIPSMLFIIPKWNFNLIYSSGREPVIFSSQESLSSKSPASLLSFTSTPTSHAFFIFWFFLLFERTTGQNTKGSQAHSSHGWPHSHLSLKRGPFFIQEAPCNSISMLAQSWPLLGTGRNDS